MIATWPLVPYHLLPCDGKSIIAIETGHIAMCVYNRPLALSQYCSVCIVNIWFEHLTGFLKFSLKLHHYTKDYKLSLIILIVKIAPSDANQISHLMALCEK